MENGGTTQKSVAERFLFDSCAIQHVPLVPVEKNGRFYYMGHMVTHLDDESFFDFQEKIEKVADKSVRSNRSQSHKNYEPHYELFKKLRLESFGYLDNINGVYDPDKVATIMTLIDFEVDNPDLLENADVRPFDPNEPTEILLRGIYCGISMTEWKEMLEATMLYENALMEGKESELSEEVVENILPEWFRDDTNLMRHLSSVIDKTQGFSVSISTSHFFKEDDPNDMDEYIALINNRPSPTALASLAKAEALSQERRFVALYKKLHVRHEGYFGDCEPPAWHMMTSVAYYMKQRHARLEKLKP